MGIARLSRITLNSQQNQVYWGCKRGVNWPIPTLASSSRGANDRVFRRADGYPLLFEADNPLKPAFGRYPEKRATKSEMRVTAVESVWPH